MHFCNYTSLNITNLSLVWVLLLMPYWSFGQCISGNCQQGQGILLFADGSTYSGAFLQGQPHGTGLCEYANGTRYQGSWKDGRPHGKGTVVRANGLQQQGIWQNGVYMAERIGTLSDTKQVQPGCLSGN
ncbi:MAG: hypothetical protein AAF840_18370, partial [Bacteroidota bacterium]